MRVGRWPFTMCTISLSKTVIGILSTVGFENYQFLGSIAFDTTFAFRFSRKEIERRRQLVQRLVFARDRFGGRVE